MRNDSIKAPYCKQNLGQKDQFYIFLSKGIDKEWEIVVNFGLKWKIDNHLLIKLIT